MTTLRSSRSLPPAVHAGGGAMLQRSVSLGQQIERAAPHQQTDRWLAGPWLAQSPQPLTSPQPDAGRGPAPLRMDSASPGSATSVVSAPQAADPTPSRRYLSLPMVTPPGSRGSTGAKSPACHRANEASFSVGELKQALRQLPLTDRQHIDAGCVASSGSTSMSASTSSTPSWPRSQPGSPRALAWGLGLDGMSPHSTAMWPAPDHAAGAALGQSPAQRPAGPGPRVVRRHTIAPFTPLLDPSTLAAAVPGIPAQDCAGSASTL